MNDSSIFKAVDYPVNGLEMTGFPLAQPGFVPGLFERDLSGSVGGVCLFTRFTLLVDVPMALEDVTVVLVSLTPRLIQPYTYFFADELVAFTGHRRQVVLVF